MCTQREKEKDEQGKVGFRKYGGRLCKGKGEKGKPPLQIALATNKNVLFFVSFEEKEKEEEDYLSKRKGNRRQGSLQMF